MAKTPDANITSLPYRERVKMAKERLSSVSQPKIKPLPEPARIAAARKMVDEWDKKSFDHDQAQRKAHREKLNAVTDALITGDMAKAVALMQKLDD